MFNDLGRILQYFCNTFKTGLKDTQIPDMEWEELSKFTRSFFSQSRKLGSDGAHREDLNWSKCDGRNEDGTNEADDYRENVKELMMDSEPCVLLLCSPPGAGKSFFAEELAELKKELAELQAKLGNKVGQLSDRDRALCKKREELLRPYRSPLIF